jgi:hypothetical protein
MSQQVLEEARPRWSVRVSIKERLQATIRRWAQKNRLSAA